jgi:hypothetical protein
MRPTTTNAKPRVILESDKDVQERNVGTHVNGWNTFPPSQHFALGAVSFCMETRINADLMHASSQYLVDMHYIERCSVD